MSYPTSGAIDCDLHPALPGIASLLPYLDDHWREQIKMRGIDGLDPQSFPHSIPANGRPDWRPPEGKPGSDLGLLRSQALDAFGSRAGILNCLYGVSAAYNPDFAAATCRALNDWIAAEWLDREPRLRASVVVPLVEPALAVTEIERRADDPRFVQVLLPVAGEIPYGRRSFWPVLEAAAKHRMPVCLHAGSAFRHPTTSNGWPSTYLEDTVVAPHAFQAQLISLITEGAFTKFPDLTVVLAEAGWTWLPNFLWRASKEWHGMRNEVPWVDRSPADIVRDSVRFTLQPADAPPDPAQMVRTIEQIGTDRFLLFSTDYPHWHFEGTDAIPAGVPEATMKRLLADNALDTYPRLARTLH